MKSIKNITIFMLFISLFISCKEEELKEYPGMIYVHGDIHYVKFNSTTPRYEARFGIPSKSFISEDLGALPAGDFTYEVWVRVDHDALIGKVDDLGDPDDPNDDTLYSGVTAGGSCIMERENNFEIYLIEDDDADFALEFARLAPPPNSDYSHLASMDSADSSINLSFNEWFHVAISRSSTDNLCKFYINGTLIDSSDDPVWIQPTNDKWLDMNYMWRFGKPINFLKGAMKNVRVSKIDRYPHEFTPNLGLRYNETIDENGDTLDIGVDEHTLIQLDLEKNLSDFEEGDAGYNSFHENYKKAEIKGSYDTRNIVRLHNKYITWDTFIIGEYPATTD